MNLVTVQILLANLTFIEHNFGTNQVRKLRLVLFSCNLFTPVIGNIWLYITTYIFYEILSQRYKNSTPTNSKRLENKAINQNFPFQTFTYWHDSIPKWPKKGPTGIVLVDHFFYPIRVSRMAWIAISCVLRAFSNRPTDRPTDRAAYRITCMRLKNLRQINARNAVQLSSLNHLLYRNIYFD